MSLSHIPVREGFIFDSCCLINLSAAERLEAVLRTTGSPCFASHEVGEEVPTLPWESLSTASLISVIELNADDEKESDLFVQLLIGGIAEGEASSAAIAATRNWTLVTDDKSAIRLVRTHIPELSILTTPDLLKQWIETEKISAAEAAEVIAAIRTRGRYIIPSEHSLRCWWKSFENE